MFAPEITEKNIITCYGDALLLQQTESGFPSIHRNFSVKHNNNILFATDKNNHYFPNDTIENWDEIINSFKEGDVRIYELNWGMVYTTDNGASFKGAARDKYTDLYKTDEEFAQVYSMLYKRPFYDERFKEHLDVKRRELLDSETAEKINTEHPKSISEIEELAGKAQRCVLVNTAEGTDKIQSVTFEYDLSDGRILVVGYNNNGKDNNLELYLSFKDIREVYNPAEEEECPGEAPVPSAFPSPSTTAA